jgi:hypothetical protein
LFGNGRHHGRGLIGRLGCFLGRDRFTSHDNLSVLSVESRWSPGGLTL